MYKLCVFVPEEHLESLKSALFKAGAGKIGQYDQCCWQTLGQGQFRPLAGSQPFIGKSVASDSSEAGDLEQLMEYKLEMVIENQLIKPVVKALKQNHPYETPAYEVWPLLDF